MMAASSLQASGRGLKPSKFGFEVANAALEFRQVAESGYCFEPFAVFQSRVAGVESTGGDVVGDTALCGDDSAFADREVACRPDLTGEDTIRADFRGAGEAHLAAQHGIGADLRS